MDILKQGEGYSEQEINFIKKRMRSVKEVVYLGFITSNKTQTFYDVNLKNGKKYRIFHSLTQDYAKKGVRWRKGNYEK